MSTVVQICQVLFFTALGVIVYTYVLFPALLLVRAALFQRPYRKGDVTPRLSVVIVAHNEAGSIGAKIENVLGQDYPSDRLEIIVASDGSDDGTNEIVAGYAGRGVRLLPCPRQGKIPALNKAVAETTGEVLAFSDANSMLVDGALRQLMRPFADPRVGAVAGNQRYRGGGQNAASFGERMYWRFDRALKSMQNRSGSITSATGALHAIRRELFHDVPSSVTDDLVVSTRAVLQGYRLVFEPQAAAEEATASTDAAEFRRKTRIMVRGLRGLWVVRGLFNPFRHGFYSFQLFSHKVLRRCVGWLLLVLLATSLVLAPGSAFFAVMLAWQLAFYLAAIVVWAYGQRRRPRWLKPCSLSYSFCLANGAAIYAWWQVLRGKRLDVWNTTHGS